jgi:glycosyltransferase involved in cell wall biosynthesis
MRPRLTIITEIIAPYRIPVFNAIARQREIDLHVIFLAETDPSIRLWRVYSDEIRFRYTVLPSWRKRVGNHTLLVNHNVSRALRKSSPEVVLCGGYNYLASWQAQRWALSAGVPFLLWSESTKNDLRSGHPFTEFLKRQFMRNCDGFVVPGRAAQEYIQGIAGASAKVFVAPNAVDNDLFAVRAASARANAVRLRRALSLPSRYFLFAGRMVREKGVFDLVAAYASLPSEIRSQIALVMAGEGPLRAELAARAQWVSPGRLHLPGFVHRDELAAYYGLADCFVFPTHTDPWGLVVNEAMACGLPVICSRAAGCAADLLGKNGILIEPGNLPEISAAMLQIATCSTMRSQMARESVTIVRAYSPEACANGITSGAITVLRNRPCTVPPSLCAARSQT